MPENPSPNQGWKNKATGPAKKDNAAWKQQSGAKADGPAGGERSAVDAVVGSLRCAGSVASG